MKAPCRRLADIGWAFPIFWAIYLSIMFVIGYVLLESL
jgi:hypothetical protein